MITARYVIRYLFMIAAITALCFMVSYDNLIWLAYAVTVAGVISSLVCIVSRKNFTVSVFTKESVCEEGHRMMVIVKLEKTGFCFIPLIELEVDCGGEAVPLAGSLMFNSSVEIPVSIDVKSCGMTEINARAMLVHDLVDAVGFGSEIKDSFTVAVIPMLRKYPFAVKLDKDDGDESLEISRVSLSGMPGSEIRHYQNGDSLRSISYKLSAKHGRLLTRISENSGGRTVSVLIATGSGCNAARLALGLAQHLAEQGMTVITEYCGDRFTATTDEIEALRHWLAAKHFGAVGGSLLNEESSYDFVVNELAVFNGMPSESETSYAYREPSEAEL